MDSPTTTKLTAAIDDIRKIRETKGVAVKGGKKYTMVQDRVEAVRRHFGTDISIETEILEYDLDLPIGRTVVVQAVILGDKPNKDTERAILAVGHASEVWGSTQVNITSALENAETSAIGRALAALGVHGGEFASANELDAVVRKSGTVGVSPNQIATGIPAADNLSLSARDDHPIPKDAEDGSNWQEINVRTELKIPETPEEWLDAIDQIKKIVTDSTWPELKAFWSSNVPFFEALKGRYSASYGVVHDAFLGRKPKKASS